MLSCPQSFLLSEIVLMLNGWVELLLYVYTRT